MKQRNPLMVMKEKKSLHLWHLWRIQHRQGKRKKEHDQDQWERKERKRKGREKRREWRRRNSMCQEKCVNRPNHQGGWRLLCNTQIASTTTLLTQEETQTFSSSNSSCVLCFFLWFGGNFQGKVFENKKNNYLCNVN